MLDTNTKRRIDTARDILVGKVPDPKSQVEQITIALIYKFMDDMDAESVGLGGKRSFFKGALAPYRWRNLLPQSVSAEQRVTLSPREQESLNLAFEGLTARETALRMDCSERTVNYHLANAMGKLKTDNKLSAVQRACWIGLI